MLMGVADCRMVTVCPGTPGAIWPATVWMTRLVAGMVAKAMVGFSSRPREECVSGTASPVGGRGHELRVSGTDTGKSHRFSKGKVH